MTDVKIAIDALANVLAQRKAEIDACHGRIATLEQEVTRFEDALEILEILESPVAPHTETVNERLGVEYVRSDSSPRQDYAVEAWKSDPADGRFLVVTCDCLAFRYSTGDQWKGERKWCKHISRAYNGFNGREKVQEAKRAGFFIRCKSVR